ncbi:MAG: hypothetical protein ACRDT8_16385 [Micromonosporaceae bacterium]
MRFGVKIGLAAATLLAASSVVATQTASALTNESSDKAASAPSELVSCRGNAAGANGCEGPRGHTPARTQPTGAGKSAKRAPSQAPDEGPAPAAVDSPSDPGASSQVLPYDVNGDGYAEVISGAPGEDTAGARSNAGMFHVLYGGPNGATGAGSIGITQDTPGVPGAAESGDWFGYSNASGDFNADGFADVAVSAGAENLGAAPNAGLVLVFYGSATGLRTDNVVSISSNHTFLAGTRDMYFGDALAVGDFDGDSDDDLAIGAAGAGGGHVFVSPGSAAGLSTNMSHYDQDTDYVPGTSDQDDLFGWSLAAGDINGDGKDDLASGAIYDWEAQGMSTGAVTVFYGADGGLTGIGAQRWTKDTTGVPGEGADFDPEIGDSPDRFGHQMAIADFNGDAKADLAVAADAAPVVVDGVRKHDAGTITVLYSTGTALGTDGATEVSQSTPGMPGKPGVDDFLGSTLASGGDSDRNGAAELAVYSPGDSYVSVVPGLAGGLAYDQTTSWTQDSAGIPGTDEPGDFWGNSLRYAHVGAGPSALIVGNDSENNGRGSLTVIYCDSAGLTGDGATNFSQDSTGVSGTAEANDGFGIFF